MADTRLDMMQTVKLQVDGVIHNIALSSSAAAKLIAGDPETVTAVINAIKLSKEKTEDVTESPEPLTQTSDELMTQTATETESLPSLPAETLVQQSSEYFSDQLEYLIPQTSEHLVQDSTEQLIQTQGFQTSESLPFEASSEAPNTSNNILVCSAVDSLLGNDSSDEDEDGFRWTDSATVTFLEQYKQMAHRFNNGREKKVHLWQELAKVMQDLGYTVSGAQLDWKWKSLRSRYRKVRDGKVSAESFMYFEAMKELFLLEQMANAMPPVLQQSMMGNDGTGGGAMVWSEEATRYLIEQYKVREERFRDGIEKKKVLWNEIADVLKTVGVSCTPEQAEGKWKSLLRAFRKAKTLGLQKKAFPFFMEMSEIQEDMESNELDFSFESQEQAEVQWTDEAINVLLDEYTSRKHRFKGDEKKKSLWLEITEELTARGFVCTLEQVVGKWKTLIRAFRKAQSSEQSRIRFAFYDKMRELIGDQNVEVTEQELAEQETQSIWTDSAVKLFLSECERRRERDEFTPGVALWTEVAQTMAAHGLSYTPEQIRRKWRSLNEEYSSCQTQDQQFAYSEQMAKLVDELSCVTKQEPSDGEQSSSFAAERMWTDIALKIFLSECQMRKTKLSCDKKRSLWEEISKALRANGYGFTTDQVENKWKSLYRRYKKAKTSKHTAERFPYLETMEELVQFCDRTDNSFADDDPWKDEAIQTLLSLLKDKCPSGNKISRALWQEITAELKEKGFSFSADQIKCKWKALCMEFKRFASCTDPQKEFLYFDKVKELIEKEQDGDVEECLESSDIDAGTGVTSSDGVDDKWNPDAIHMLIKEYKSRKQRCTGQTAKRFWDQVAAVLQMKGLDFNPDQLQRQWDVLVKLYKKASHLEKPNKYFQYYSLMTDIVDKEEVDRDEESLSDGGQMCCQCGERKEPYDDHPDGCRRCLRCEVDRTCSVCARWPEDIWQKTTKPSTINIKRSPSSEQLTEDADLWPAEVIQILLEEYKLRKDKFQKRSNSLLWIEIVKVLKSKGHCFSKEQLEDKWKELVKCYFTQNDSKLSAKHREMLKEILGQAKSNAYNRGLTSRLRARPKRKYPWDASMLGTSESSTSGSRGGYRSSSGRHRLNEESVSQSCLTMPGANELKSFLREFVERQIEVEERSFRRLKTAHETKIKSLNDLLSSLDGK